MGKGDSPLFPFFLKKSIYKNEKKRYNKGSILIKNGDRGFNMYSEKSYKNYIFWVQVKRVVVIIILSCLGAALGILIGKVLESTVQVTSFNNIIIAGSTIVFFLLALLLTVGTGKQVQDGYWKIAVLRKLTVIQKALEQNNELLRNTNITFKNGFAPIHKSENIEEEVNDDSDINFEAMYKYDETALVPQKKVQKQKKKFFKSFKKPQAMK